MIKIGKYLVSSNNYSTRQQASVYVRCDGMILCKMRFEEPVCDPLRQIQMYPNTPARKEFIERLQASGVPAEDINMLLRVQPTKYFLDKQKKAKNEPK